MAFKFHNVAGVGYFTSAPPLRGLFQNPCLPQAGSVLNPLRSILHRGDTKFPLRPTPRSNPTLITQRKKKSRQAGYFLSSVAGVGFEPTTSRLCLPLQFSLLRLRYLTDDEFVVRTFSLSASWRIPAIKSLHLVQH